VKAGEQPFLILDWQDSRIALDTSRDRLVFGSRADVDLRVPRPHVSRLHGRIERRRDTFVLIDESTNGTFVQTEDERVVRVHRGELRLWGEGWFSPGEPLSDASAIRFRHD
jgi:adenylate cyclase